MLGYTPRPALCACTWSFSVMHATHARTEDFSEKSSDHLSAIALHDLLVGRRVRVFWASDKTWYSGSLGEYLVSSGKHLCQYDDGETEWLNLGREKYELDEGTGIACPSHVHAPGAPCSSIGPVCFQTCRSCIAVHDGMIRAQVLHALRSHYMSTPPCTAGALRGVYEASRLWALEILHIKAEQQWKCRTVKPRVEVLTQRLLLAAQVQRPGSSALVARGRQPTRSAWCWMTLKTRMQTWPMPTAERSLAASLKLRRKMPPHQRMRVTVQQTPAIRCRCIFLPCTIN